MTDADITAFRAAPVAPQPRRRRVWPWLLGALLLIGVLAVGALATLVSTVDDWTGNGVHLTINDETIDLAGVHGGHAAAGVLLALAAVVVVVLVVVPLVVAIALLGATVGVATALFAACVVLAVACSPLLLIFGAVWLVVRPRRSAPATA
jgi:hypothetical protein